MTKARDPLTVEDAVTKIAAAIGWDGAAAAVGKTERMVRYWSDPDEDREPSITQAIKLDAAYRAKTGSNTAPLLTAYAHALGLDGFCPETGAALIALAAAVARETGEAAAAVMEAALPGASPAVRAKAVRELDEAAEVIGRSRAALGAPVLKAVS
jgi:hypothetical protein